MSTHLPAPNADALASSQALCRLIEAEISRNHGWLPFSRFMDLALYAPQYGYYSGGGTKFGAAGDFVTAPTLSPLFGQTLAVQINALLPQTAGVVYEFGAGNGALAATLLQSLDSTELKQYCIIELSAELAARQRQYLAEHAPASAHKVVHLDRLPETLDGVIIGNEVLDAMPVSVVRWQANGIEEMGVVQQASQFEWAARPLADPALLAMAAPWAAQLPPGFSSLRAQGRRPTLSPPPSLPSPLCRSLLKRYRLRNPSLLRHRRRNPCRAP